MHHILIKNHFDSLLFKVRGYQGIYEKDDRRLG